MIKYLKYHVQNGSSGYVYPTGWDDKEFIHAGYVEDKEEGKLYVLACGEEADISDLLDKPYVTELTKEGAIALSEALQTRKEIETDPAKIKRLAIKATLGQEFTADELKAIDPNDPEPGIGISEILADKFSAL
jgi:hypothetical protein